MTEPRNTTTAPRGEAYLFFASLLLSIVFVALVCWIFNPIWETCDDVQMSMAAHGYGVMAQGSPNIFFSNVVWGMLARAWPEGLGVHGYSVISIGSLVAVSTLLLFGLVRIGLGYAIALPTTALLMMRPLVFTQYTMTAGLLGVAVCWAGWMDSSAYASADWATYNAFEKVVRPFVDFGGSRYLSEHPEILARHGYSSNDIQLFGDWFFADPKITNPVALKSMLGELSPFFLQPDSLANAIQGLKTLFRREFWAPVGAAVLVGLLLPNRRALMTAALCLGAIFTLGLLGRPSVMRVYVPLIALVLIAYLMLGHLRVDRMRLVAAVLLLACLGQVAKTAREYHKKTVWAEQVLDGFEAFPTDDVVIWNGHFPYEVIYPVFSDPVKDRRSRIYILDFPTLAPSSVSAAEEARGRGMIGRLTSPEGVRLVATPQSMELLETYCTEHFRAPLEELSTRRFGKIINDYGEIVMHRIRCRPNPAG